MSVKIEWHRISWLVFISFFSTVILSVYTERIFSSVYIDGYYKGIFSRKNSPQSTKKIYGGVTTIKTPDNLILRISNFGISSFL
jgi:hypothetical protein